MSVHFQIYSPLPDGTLPGTVTRVIRWRLVSSNNRAIAMSANAFTDFASAREDAAAFSAGLLSCELRVHAATATGWSWTLLRDGQPVAQSVRSFARRLECEQNIAHVTRLAPRATVPTVLRLFGQQRARTVEHSDHSTWKEDMTQDPPVGRLVRGRVEPLAPVPRRDPVAPLTSVRRATAR